MKYLLSTVILAVTMAAQTAPAAKPAPATPEKSVAPERYEMTELETLKLQNVQKDIALQNAQMSQLQDQFSKLQLQQRSSISDLQKLQDGIKVAHKWGNDVQYNFQTGAWEKAAKK